MNYNEVKQWAEYNEVKQWAEKFDKKLEIPAFKFAIYVNHSDESRFVFRNSVAYQNKDFLVVFTEHNGFHIFFRGDISYSIYILTPYSITPFDIPT
jgi:hypothetical protein